MTNQEIINHYNTITEIRRRIGGCFGSVDGIFAGHPSDEERAKELRNLAADNQISLLEVQEIVLGYLYRKGFLEKHLKDEFENATKLFSKKLN